MFLTNKNECFPIKKKNFFYVGKVQKKKDRGKSSPRNLLFGMYRLYTKKIFFYIPLKKTLLNKMSSKTKIQNKWKKFSF